MLVDGSEEEQRALSNCATIAVAKKIVREPRLGHALSSSMCHPHVHVHVHALAHSQVRELPAGATVTLEEFERLAAAKVAGIEESAVRLSSRDTIGEEVDWFTEALEMLE